MKLRDSNNENFEDRTTLTIQPHLPSMPKLTPEDSTCNSVIADRGGVIENTHSIHIAIVDGHGNLLFSTGNPSRLTLMRSAAKPAQALAILETGCFEACKFDQADLALMCASHNSEERHVERARSMLRKAGVEEEDLRMGPHPSISESVSREWVRKGFEPTAVNNNCSGKHAGMLAGCRALGGAVETYHESGNAMQKKVKAVVRDLAELEEDEVRWSIDGCNLPAPAVPLLSMARIFEKFAKAVDGPEEDERTARMAQIFHAMAEYPDMVAGEGRFCTELMGAYKGALIGKVGADGCYGVGFRASPATRALLGGKDGSIGIAVKIEDGNLDVLYSVVAEILERLHIGNEETGERLRRWREMKRMNTAGVKVGQYTHAWRLREHTDDGGIGERKS